MAVICLKYLSQVLSRANRAYNFLAYYANYATLPLWEGYALIHTKSVTSVFDFYFSSNWLYQTK